MANIINQYGQVKLGVRYVSAPLTSTLWGNVFGVWNADTLGTSLDTNIFRVYNGDNVNDSSGNALNGTNVNNVTFTTGKIGNAFTFNGSNYVSLPDNSLNLSSTDFTISAWVNLTNIISIQSILHNYTEVINDFRGFFLIVANSRIYFRIDNGDIISNDLTSTSITTNAWTHIVITRKASTRSRMYVNGILVASDTSTVNPTFFPTMSNNYIGAYRDSNGFRYISNGGKIDAVNVWQKELTASEITSLYNSGTGAEYPFSPQTLPSPNDAVSTNHGTLMNGCTFATGKIGKAFTFDGVNDYVALPTTSLNLVDDFSVSLWAYFNSFSNNGLVSNYYRLSPFTVYYGWSIIALGGKITFDTYNGVNATNQRVETSALATGNWYHIVVNYKEGVNTTIYINGTLSVTGNTTTPIGYSGNETPTIGGVQAGTGYQYPLNGKLDSVTVWNKVLTSTEVTELYNSGNGKQYPTT